MAKIAEERNRKTFELNGRGVLIAERGDSDKTLDYFYKSERLMLGMNNSEKQFKQI